MSSTNRGAERAPADNYPTPAWAVHAILDAMSDLPGGRWLEPAVGDGAIVRGVEQRRASAPPTWATCDIRDVAPVPYVRTHFHGDFLLMARLDWEPDVIITNPPFSLAEPFARRCIEIADGGIVLLLLRLAFLESQGRIAFHRDHPADIYPLARRPSFSANGKTDSCAYAWWVWGRGRGGRWYAPIGGK